MSSGLAAEMAKHSLMAAAPRSIGSVIGEAIDRCLGRGLATTRAAQLIHGTSGVDSLLNAFVLASLPALVVGTWAWGSTVAGTFVAGEEIGLVGWQAWLVGAIHGRGLPAIILGIGLFLPQLFVAIAVSLLVEVAFAIGRKRPVNAGWLTMAWLYALLLPPVSALYLVAIALVFGAVLGKHIFGGTGRYIVNPALLGVVFLQLGFPDAYASSGVAGLIVSTWDAAVAGGAAALDELGWWNVFMGREIGAIGAASAAACLLGTIYLWFRGAASLRIAAGGLAGVGLAVISISAFADADTVLGFPIQWHLALGSLGFVLAFIAMDPTTMPATRAGRWIFGGLIGALTVLIRELNPEHLEGALTATLLASLCIPLIDHLTVRFHIRRQRRKGMWP